MQRIVPTLICAATLAACGAASTATSNSPGSGAGTSSGATIATGSTSLGTVLTDQHGMTLYYFLPEKGGTTTACNAMCLTAWPPVVSSGTPSAPSGVTGTLGVVSITYNGANVNEVTYNGWPLHTYSGDSSAGQTNGQNVENTWFAAEPGTTADETGATTSGSGSGSNPTPAGTPTPSSTTGGGYGY